MRDIDLAAALATPAWAKEFERSMARFTESLRPMQEAATRTLTALPVLQELGRSTAYLKQFQPHQEMLDQLAGTKKLSGLDQLAKRLDAEHEQVTRQARAFLEQQDRFLRPIEHLRSLEDPGHETFKKLTSTSQAEYESLARVTSGALMLENLIKGIPSLENFRSQLLALDNVSGQPFLDYVRRADVSTLERAIRQAQPSLPTAEAHVIAEALSEEASDLATVLPNESQATLLDGFLALWQRLKNRSPTAAALILNVLAGLLVSIPVSFISSKQTSDEIRNAATRLETKLEEHAASEKKDIADVKRLIRETHPTPAPKPALPTAVVQHAVPLRADHADTSRILAELFPNQRVTILASGRHWAQIAVPGTPSPVKGWVRKKYLRRTL